MRDKLVDEISALLHRDGFKDISKHSSSTSISLSAKRDGEQAFFHVARDCEQASAEAVRLANAAKGLDVKKKASFPGIDSVASRVEVSRIGGQLQRR
jgi:predicted transcriptional regulator